MSMFTRKVEPLNEKRHSALEDSPAEERARN